MVLLPNNQDLSAGSGVMLGRDCFEEMYHCMMDQSFLLMARPIILHLDPEIEQDVVTQSQPQPQQYNPFFGRTPVPNTNTRNPGIKITHRDIQYDAHIRLGPQKADNDNQGIGELKDGEAMITLVIEALPYIKQTISISIEGRRYSIEEPTRPIGFSVRRYIMLKLKEIQERESPSDDITIG